MKKIEYFVIKRRILGINDLSFVTFCQYIIIYNSKSTQKIDEQFPTILLIEYRQRNLKSKENEVNIPIKNVCGKKNIPFIQYVKPFDQTLS